MKKYTILFQSSTGGGVNSLTFEAANLYAAIEAFDKFKRELSEENAVLINYDNVDLKSYYAIEHVINGAVHHSKWCEQPEGDEEAIRLFNEEKEYFKRVYKDKNAKLFRVDTQKVTTYRQLA